MRTTLRTSDLPARSRTKVWREELHQQGLVEVQTDENVVASISLTRTDLLQVSDALTATRQLIMRRPHHIRRFSDDRIHLSLCLDGQPQFSTERTDKLLSPGDIFVYDANNPFTLNLPGDKAVHLVSISVARTDLPDAAFTALTSTQMSEPDAALIRPLIRRLATTERPVVANRLSHVLVDLLAATALDSRELPEFASRHEAQLVVFQDYIRQHLHDPTLTPPLIAAAHFVSLRQLHRVFSAAGLSVASWIRSQRLAACAAQLRDPRFGHLRVNDIGTRWGIRDPAQFSRAFRAQYGVPPQEYRREMTSSTA